MLGDKNVKFVENTLLIDDVSFPMTSGLAHLILSKKLGSYSSHDLETYRQILTQTSAHLSANREKIKKGGIKYTHVIKKLFSSGEGMGKNNNASVKLQNYNLVYYDDPNELRLLLASQAAGNTGVSNEILSIYEELYEAGLIHKIPNV